MASTDPPIISRIVRRIVPIVAVLIGTFFFHRYTILSGFDAVQADTGDSRFVTAILEHWNNVLHGTARWQVVPIFWPAKDTLAFSDALLGMGLLHAALRTVFDVFTALNVQEILLSVLTFVATHAFLARGVRLSTWGATAGAAFAAFCWPRFACLPHVQLQFTAPMPLIFLLVMEALRDGFDMSRLGFAWRMTAAAALGALLLTTVVYYAIFTALALAIAILLSLLCATSRRQLIAVVRRQWPGLIVAVVCASLLSAPVVVLYLPLMRETGGRSWIEVMPSLPRPRHFFWMGRENWLWGAYFARYPEADIESNWPELRIGVGIVASLAWGAGIAWALVTLCRRPLCHTGLIALLILTGAALQVSMLALPSGRSAWWVVWRFFPGANGLRAIARLEIVVTLAMAVWLGALVDRAALHTRAWPKAVAILLVVACALEQFGTSSSFAGRRMETFERGIAAQLEAPCQAAFVTGTSDMMATPISDESKFDATAYLTANPDVAQNWHGTAWSHYQLLGRAEGRFFDAQRANERKLLAALGYTYALPLAAVLAQKPIVNGYSGTEPTGWHLGTMLGPNAGVELARWLELNHKPPGSVCTIPIRITLDMIPFLPDHTLWP